jgi:hypothetical protein
MRVGVTKLVSFAFMAAAYGSTPIELSIALKPERGAYKPGDNLMIQIAYHNASRRAVRILPDLLVYPAAAFKFRKLLNGSVGKTLKYSQIDVDVEQWAKDVVVLNPGKTYTRALSIKVVDRLPKEYGRLEGGLFILFPVSAVQLPSPGRYAVTMTYDSVEHPVRRAVHGSPKLWEGQAASPAIFATFER